MIFFEWLASALVVLGVNMMIFWHDYASPGHAVLSALGVVALTFGVRLVIDVAKIPAPADPREDT